MDRHNQYCNSPGTLAVELAITIGASGAVSSVAGKGGFTVAKNTTGVYDITNPHKFTSVRYLDGSVQRATGATLHPRLEATYTPSTTLQFKTVVSAGTATEPSSGDIVYVRIVYAYEGT